MKTSDIPSCEQVQMAAMAHLDGERGDLTAAEVEAHLAGCAGCRAAVSTLTTLQSRMNRFDYERLDIDVWPGVREAMTAGSPQPEPQRKPRFVLVLASLLVVWRLAQLSVDLPAPVVNSVVPLALMVLVLWKVTGDPFAIQVTTQQLQREGAR
jgi:predicted anti-sigma-YlaC factor YlaD